LCDPLMSALYFLPWWLHSISVPFEGTSFVTIWHTYSIDNTQFLGILCFKLGQYSQWLFLKLRCHRISTQSLPTSVLKKRKVTLLHIWEVLKVHDDSCITFAQKCGDSGLCWSVSNLSCVQILYKPSLAR
jgi:hypothetical protein